MATRSESSLEPSDIVSDLFKVFASGLLLTSVRINIYMSRSLGETHVAHVCHDHFHEPSAGPVHSLVHVVRVEKRLGRVKSC